MELRDEFNEKEELVLEPGTPTITFSTEDREVMISWLSFRHGFLEKEKIQLFFQAWMVEIQGDDLASLWTELQTQSVRAIFSLDQGERKGFTIVVNAI